MEISTAVWIIGGLGLGIIGMLWHLARRAKKYEKSITLGSSKSTVVGQGNVVIQNNTIKRTDYKTSPVRTLPGYSSTVAKESKHKSTSYPSHEPTTFDTSGTVIWPTDDSPRVIHTPAPSNDDNVSFGGGSFGGGGAGDSYDYGSSHSHSDSGSSWGGDSGSSYSSDTSSYDSGSSWSSSD